MKQNIFLLTFLFSSVLFFSQIQISDHSVMVDEQNHIIVINKDIESINNSITGDIQDMTILGKAYIFPESKKSFEIGQKYTVKLDNAEYALFFSTLPIIKMSTQGDIVDSPNVLGNFELLYSDKVQISSLVGVQYRGKSSQSYPKKSMEVEFWKDGNGEETVDYSVLDLAKEDSFNLQALYNENLRINSKTANEVWQLIHPNVSYIDKENDAKSGISMEYVDLFINGEYRGIYAAGDKVKRKLLKLKKLEDDKLKGEIYKAAEWGGATYFYYQNPYDNNSDFWDGYEYKYPKDLIDWKNLYDFIGFVVKSDKKDFDANYSKKIDVNNALDYFIFINLLRATDNMLKNSYLAKYKKDDPYFYIPWDLDGTFGSIWDGSNQDITDDLLFNGLFSSLWEDEVFRIKLSKRWQELRSTVVKKDELNNMLTQNYLLLKNNGVYDREKLKWSEHNFSEQQLQYHFDWLSRRIDYLDTAFLYNDMAVTESLQNSFEIYPNPTSDYFYLNIDQPESEVKIIDFAGNEIKKMKFSSISKTTRIPVSDIPAGSYFVIFKSSNLIRAAKLIIK